jgi:hypothetical protein
MECFLRRTAIALAPEPLSIFLISRVAEANTNANQFGIVGPFQNPVDKFEVRRDGAHAPV